MLGGYRNRLLRFNLSRGKFSDEKFEENTLKDFIGGSGLATKILFEETSVINKPLAPANKLIFMTGPMTGTAVPTSSRYSVVSLSPKTGILGESNSSGYWGSELKKAGYDGIILEGKAPSPIYIWINNGKVSIVEANHIWGRDTLQTDEIIKSETSNKAIVACIGPSGEKMVGAACIVNDGINARVAGRTGMGAVMGSKNIKAIAVQGTQNINVASKTSLIRSVRDIIPLMKNKAKRMSDYGTAQGVINYERIGSLPIKNWLNGSWPEGAKRISGEYMAETILTGNYRCKGCPIGCGREVRIDTGRYAGVKGAGPEYETIAFFGSMCLVDDLEAISKANEMCNRYGLDTMSTGACVAFAMEAYEKGLLSKEDLDGIELEWGNADAMIALVDKIAKREGFGEILGSGVREAAKVLGPRAEEFAIHVKGLEISAHDPRAFHSAAVAYATGNRGGCHLQGGTHWAEASVAIPELGWDMPFNRFGTEGKGEMVAKMQDLMSLFDALGVCKFSLFGGIRPHHLNEWLNFITGWELNLQQFMKIGERLYNLKRIFNVRSGISRKDDTLPMRLLTHRRGEGGTINELPNLGTMLSDYYAYRGWSEDGIPSYEKLTDLALTDYQFE